MCHGEGVEHKYTVHLCLSIVKRRVLLKSGVTLVTKSFCF